MEPIHTHNATDEKSSVIDLARETRNPQDDEKPCDTLADASIDEKAKSDANSQTAPCVSSVPGENPIDPSKTSEINVPEEPVSSEQQQMQQQQPWWAALSEGERQAMSPLSPKHHQHAYLPSERAARLLNDLKSEDFRKQADHADADETAEGSPVLFENAQVEKGVVDCASVAQQPVTDPTAANTSSACGQPRKDKDAHAHSGIKNEGRGKEYTERMASSDSSDDSDALDPQARQLRALLLDPINRIRQQRRRERYLLERRAHERESDIAAISHLEGAAQPADFANGSGGAAKLTQVNRGVEDPSNFSGSDELGSDTNVDGTEDEEEEQGDQDEEDGEMSDESSTESVSTSFSSSTRNSSRRQRNDAGSVSSSVSRSTVTRKPTGKRSRSRLTLPRRRVVHRQQRKSFSTSSSDDERDRVDYRTTRGDSGRGAARSKASWSSSAKENGASKRMFATLEEAQLHRIIRHVSEDKACWMGFWDRQRHGSIGMDRSVQRRYVWQRQRHVSPSARRQSALNALSTFTKRRSAASRRGGEPEEDIPTHASTKSTPEKDDVPSRKREREASDENSSHDSERDDVATQDREDVDPVQFSFVQLSPWVTSTSPVPFPVTQTGVGIVGGAAGNSTAPAPSSSSDTQEAKRSKTSGASSPSGSSRWSKNRASSAKQGPVNAATIAEGLAQESGQMRWSGSDASSGNTSGKNVEASPRSDAASAATVVGGPINEAAVMTSAVQDSPMFPPLFLVNRILSRSPMQFSSSGTPLFHVPLLTPVFLPCTDELERHQRQHSSSSNANRTQWTALARGWSSAGGGAGPSSSSTEAGSGGSGDGATTGSGRRRRVPTSGALASSQSSAGGHGRYTGTNTALLSASSAAAAAFASGMLAPADSVFAHRAYWLDDTMWAATSGSVSPYFRRKRKAKFLLDDVFVPLERDVYSRYASSSGKLRKDCCEPFQFLTTRTHEIRGAMELQMKGFLLVPESAEKARSSSSANSNNNNNNMSGSGSGVGGSGGNANYSSTGNSGGTLQGD